jgi:hypothetical protein
MQICDLWTADPICWRCDRVKQRKIKRSDECRSVAVNGHALPLGGAELGNWIGMFIVTITQEYEAMQFDT